MYAVLDYPVPRSVFLVVPSNVIEGLRLNLMDDIIKPSVQAFLDAMNFACWRTDNSLPVRILVPYYN